MMAALAGEELVASQPLIEPLIERLFGAARDKSLHLPTHLHPAWIATLLPTGIAAPAQPDGPPSAAAARWSTLVAQALGVSWPDLYSLRARTHRLALLPRPFMLRVLSAAALSLRTSAVRRCVGRDARQALMAAVGEPAYRALLDLPDAGPGSVLDPSTLSNESWALDGYRALRADGLLSCEAASGVVRLSLVPPARNGKKSVTRLHSSGEGLAAFVDRLQDFFPEQSWLFGSDMDRALSGLTTASSPLQTSPH